MLSASVLADCGRRERDVVTPGKRDAVAPALLVTYILDIYYLVMDACFWYLF